MPTPEAVNTHGPVKTTRDNLQAILGKSKARHTAPVGTVEESEALPGAEAPHLPNFNSLRRQSISVVQGGPINSNNEDMEVVLST